MFYEKDVHTCKKVMLSSRELGVPKGRCSTLPGCSLVHLACLFAAALGHQATHSAQNVDNL